MKRFVVFFLVLFLFHTVVLAENTDVADVSWWNEEMQEAVTEELPIYKNEKFIYSVLPDETIAVLSYLGSETKVDIAKSFPGQIVSSINNYSFSQNGTIIKEYCIDDVNYRVHDKKTIKEVIVPDTVAYLGNMLNGVQHLYGPVKFNVPNSIRYVGNYVLNSTNYSEIPYFGENVIFEPGTQFADLPARVVTIPEGYKMIPQHWFGALNAEKIIFSDGIETIGSDTFTRCDNVTKVIFPNTLTEIGDNAFNDCEKLATVSLPKSLRFIADTAFMGCPIRQLTFEEGTTSISTKAFADHGRLATLDLPTTLITIGERCFLGSGLTKIVIPANVTTIGEAAFKNSETLKDITLPASLTNIANDAFDGCASNAVFTVFTGTYAEQWANERGYKTKVLVPVAEITLNEESVTLNKGRSIALKATVGPKEATNRKVEWISTDSDVAKVQNGQIQAKGCGSCEIICRAADGSGTQAVCQVTVIQMITSLQAKPQKLTIPYGEAGEVEVTLNPADATNQTLAWSSSDESVCVVDETGKIMSVGSGDCEIVCSTTDGSNKSAKIKVHVPIFDSTEASYTVTEKDGLLIPVDLHGASVADVTHKPSSDKYFLYYFDKEGLHIFPIAEGTATITLTSDLDKKDKMVTNVTVDKSALYDTANGEVAPLNVIVTLDKSVVEPGEQYTMKYHITGGVPPYTIQKATKATANGGVLGGVGRTDIKITSGKSGTKQIKADRYGCSCENISMLVVDSIGNYVERNSNVARIESLHLAFSQLTLIADKNSAITVPYHIEGGSGKYRIRAEWSDNQLMSLHTEEIVTSSYGEVSFVPPAYCERVSLHLDVVDTKDTKKSFSVFTPWISISDKQKAVLCFDTSRPKRGETVNLSLICEGIKPSYICISKYTRDETLMPAVVEEMEYLQPEIRAHGEYVYTFNTDVCDYMLLDVKLENDTYSSYDMHVQP